MSLLCTLPFICGLPLYLETNSIHDYSLQCSLAPAYLMPLWALVTLVFPCFLEPTTLISPLGHLNLLCFLLYTILSCSELYQVNEVIDLTSPPPWRPAQSTQPKVVRFKDSLPIHLAYIFAYQLFQDCRDFMLYLPLPSHSRNSKNMYGIKSSLIIITAIIIIQAMARVIFPCRMFYCLQSTFKYGATYGVGFCCFIAVTLEAVVQS
jgi:hypothetical protein